VSYDRWNEAGIAAEAATLNDSFDTLKQEKARRFTLSFNVCFTEELLEKWKVPPDVLPHMCFYFSYSYPYSYTRL